MIFFVENIEPFNAANEMRISPIPCELITGETGFFLSKNWKKEVEAKGAKTILIEKKDLKIISELHLEINK